MLRNKKIYATLIALLSCISLLSVGYASWTIVSGSSEVSGNITADDVLFTDKYAKVQEYEPLLYCNYGFVNRTDNVSLSKTGNMKVALQLNNLTEFHKKFGGNSIDIELDFKFKKTPSTFDLFNSNSLPLNIKVYDAGKVNEIILKDSDIIKNDNLITIKLNSKEIIDNDTFFIDFIWTNTDSNLNALKIQQNWFFNNVKDTLAIKDLFSFSVKLNAKGGNA